jgi:hypothetical protein
MKIRWGGWGSPRVWIAIFGVLLISFALSSNRPSALNGALIVPAAPPALARNSFSG